MIEVSNQFNLQRETLYLSYQYILRFLRTIEGQKINTGNLQIVGCAAIRIASKFHENE